MTKLSYTLFISLFIHHFLSFTAHCIYLVNTSTPFSNIRSTLDLTLAFAPNAILKPHLHALKKSARHAKFRLPVPRLPPGGSLGTPKILSTGATLHVGPIRFTCRKLGVPYLKIVSTVPKIWRAVPIFLARVNEVEISLMTA